MRGSIAKSKTLPASLRASDRVIYCLNDSESCQSNEECPESIMTTVINTFEAAKLCLLTSHPG